MPVQPGCARAIPAVIFWQLSLPWDSPRGAGNAEEASVP